MHIDRAQARHLSAFTFRVASLGEWQGVTNHCFFLSCR
jgi:hypothetical protein